MHTRASLLFLLFLSAAVINAQMTFTQNYQVPTGAAGTVTTTSNGLIVDLHPTTKAGFILSDIITPTTTPTDYYITLVCANGPVDFGPQFGTPLSDFGDMLLVTSGVGSHTNMYGVNYPGTIVEGFVSNPYNPSLGETLRFTLTAYSEYYHGELYYEYILRDMSGNYLMNTPINPQGLQTSGLSAFFSPVYDLTFGFEALNCAQAKFCVQTAAQAANGAGNCDNGATTSTSCSSTLCGAVFTAAIPGSTFFENNAIVSACTNPYVQTSTTYCSNCDSPCVECNPNIASSCFSCSSSTGYPYQYHDQCVADCSTYSLLGYNGKCYRYCPSGSGTYGYNGQCVSSCPSATYISNGECVSSCPSGTYASNGVCTACATLNCMTCPSNTCSACVASYYLSSGLCVSSCPSGTYASNGACTACDTSNCMTCPSNTCSACMTNYYLSNGLCVSSCPSGTYGYNGECVSSCPSGTYASDGACTACASSNCMTCPSNVCTACMANLYLSSGQCISSCPNGAYASSGVCTSCTASNCRTCPSNNCTACVFNYRLTNSQCILPANSATSSSKSIMTGGIIAAIVICSIIGFTAMTFGVYLLFKKYIFGKGQKYIDAKGKATPIPQPETKP